jgi:hypothetical protein
LAATSSDPNFATNNVETVVKQGAAVKIGGAGFDTAHGVALDLFCACPGGKVGPFFLNPGNLGLGATTLSVPIPASGANAPPDGPGSFVVTNAGPSGAFTAKSNAVSAVIGARITVSSVTQAGSIISVNGTGFSRLTVINFFNRQHGVAVNLGGLTSTGGPKIPLTFINSKQFTFKVPAGAIAGPAYVQALNPPYVPFSSSGDTPDGAFTLGGTAGPRLFVANFSNNSVTLYPLTANGNVLPAATLSGAATGLDGPASVIVDKGGKSYVVNNVASSVTVYNPGATGNASPAANIAGVATGLDGPVGAAVDSGGRVLVTNLSASGPAFDSVRIFKAAATGNTAPAAVIAGSNTGLNTPLDVKLDAAQRIYVANAGGNDVLIFAAGPVGTVNPAPVAKIAGAKTGLNGPNALAFDSSGMLYVANDLGSITVYAAGASGNALPVRTISGTNTRLNEPLGIALDASRRIYAADVTTDSIVVFAAGATGNAAPVAVISGSNTKLFGVGGIAVH